MVWFVTRNLLFNAQLLFQHRVLSQVIVLLMVCFRMCSHIIHFYNISNYVVRVKLLSNKTVPSFLMLLICIYYKCFEVYITSFDRAFIHILISYYCG